MRKMLSVTLTDEVSEETARRWCSFQELFTELYENVAQRAPLDGVSVNISTLDLDGGDSGEEFFDENTLFKVSDAIRMHARTEAESREIITSMQNSGILFRERRP